MRIADVLMQRDGLSREEAERVVDDLKISVMEAIENGEDPEETLLSEVGLEPDFLMELIDY